MIFFLFVHLVLEPCKTVLLWACLLALLKLQGFYWDITQCESFFLQSWMDSSEPLKSVYYLFIYFCSTLCSVFFVLNFHYLHICFILHISDIFFLHYDYVFKYFSLHLSFWRKILFSIIPSILESTELLSWFELPWKKTCVRTSLHEVDLEGDLRELWWRSEEVKWEDEGNPLMCFSKQVKLKRLNHIPLGSFHKEKPASYPI